MARVLNVETQRWYGAKVAKTFGTFKRLVGGSLGLGFINEPRDHFGIVVVLVQQHVDGQTNCRARLRHAMVPTSKK